MTGTEEGDAETTNTEGRLITIVQVMFDSEPEQAGARCILEGLELPFRWCPRGEFLMGSPSHEQGRWEIEVQHRVMHSSGFWMAEVPISQRLWERVCGTSLRDQLELALNDTEVRLIDGVRRSQRAFLGADVGDVGYLGHKPYACPMHFVSWHESKQFCELLTRAAHEAGNLPRGWSVRLPTEAEWEYACRSGTTSATYAGDLDLSIDSGASVLDKIAWHPGNWHGIALEDQSGSIGRTRIGPAPIGMKTPNQWGLLDMIGNVWEWCLDAEHEYAREPVRDPFMGLGTRRIPRGGSWYRLSRACRAANRGADDPSLRANFVGLRPVVTSRRLDA